jgi:hypothetical protein
MTSVDLSLFIYQDDARSNKHKIYKYVFTHGEDEIQWSKQVMCDKSHTFLLNTAVAM